MTGRERKGERGGDIRVGEWSVERRLATERVEGRGPTEAKEECGGYCCRHGVYISLPERERILENAERIQAAMDETQTTEVDEWFEDEIHDDSDFEGGLCIGTAIYNDKCAFLDRDGLCVLQKLETDSEVREGRRLKPFYCRLFPITTWYGRLEFDPLCNGARPCCTISERGRTPTIDAFAFELREALGEEGYQELRRVARTLDDRSVVHQPG